MKSFLFSLLSLLLILSHLQVSEGCNPCQGNQLSSSGGFGKFYPRFLGNWVYIRDFDGNPEFYCSDCAGLRAYAVRIQRILYYRENIFHKKTFSTSSTLQMLILIKFPKTISSTLVNLKKLMYILMNFEKTKLALPYHTLKIFHTVWLSHTTQRLHC